MSEIKKYVEILHYKVTMLCDECGKGDMEVAEINLMIATDPPRYKHKCNHCGKEEVYSKPYPYIEQQVLNIPQWRGEE